MTMPEKLWQKNRSLLPANLDDLCYVTATIVDKNGIPCPTASNQLQFRAKGAGTFRAACNGDATSLEQFHLPTMKAFSGKVVILVQSTPIAGNIELAVSGKGLKTEKCTIGDTFKVNDVSIKLTAADHAWKNDYPKYGHHYDFEDYCGYWIDTPDGSIWAIGDSRFLDEQLNMKDPDVIFFDFSDSNWHIGFDNAVKLANHYPKADLLLCHWGSVDAPTMTPFNGNPLNLIDKVIHPERIHVVAPGEAFKLNSR